MSNKGPWDSAYNHDELNKAVLDFDPKLHHGKKVFVYYNLHNNHWSIRHKGKIIGHSKNIVIDNPQFKVSEAGRQRVLREKAKNVHAGVVGIINGNESSLEHPDKKRVSYNPYKGPTFVVSGSNEPVASGGKAHMFIEEKDGEAGKKVRIPHVFAADLKAPEVKPELGKSDSYVTHIDIVKKLLGDLEKAKIYDFKSGKMIADLGEPKHTTPPLGNLKEVPKSREVPTDVKPKHPHQRFLDAISKPATNSIIMSQVSEKLDKGKNAREQRKKIFGTQSRPSGAMREKHMAAIKDFFERRYNVSARPTPGKLNAMGKLIDKPSWTTGYLEYQNNPEAAVHEGGHFEQIPEGVTMEEHQRQMDRNFGITNQKYGYLSGKQTQFEIQPMAAENLLRRRMGLPATKIGHPAKESDPPRMARDTGTPAAVRVKDAKGVVKDLIRQSRLLSPENRERTDMIDRGELQYEKGIGFIPGSSVDSMINQRARQAAKDPSRKDAKTLLRSEGINKTDKINSIGLSTNQSRKIRYNNERGVNKPVSMGTGGVGESSQGFTVRGGGFDTGRSNAKRTGHFDRDMARSKAKGVLKELQNMPKPNLPKSELSKAKADKKLETGMRAAGFEPSEIESAKRKARIGRKPIGEHGVHEAEHGGTSIAGGFLRDKDVESAKKEHRDIIKELKRSPKPALKSESLDKATLSLVGSKGAKLGTTQSGKDIFSHGMVGEYEGFSAQDHKEAAAMHEKASGDAKDAKAKQHHFNKAKLHAQASVSAEAKQKRHQQAQAAPAQKPAPAQKEPAKLFDPKLSGKVDYMKKTAPPGPKIVSPPFEINRTIQSDPMLISGPAVVHGNDEKAKKVKGNLLDKLKKLKRS